MKALQIKMSGRTYKTTMQRLIDYKFTVYTSAAVVRQVLEQLNNDKEFQALAGNYVYKLQGESGAYYITANYQKMSWEEGHGKTPLQALQAVIDNKFINFGNALHLADYLEPFSFPGEKKEEKNEKILVNCERNNIALRVERIENGYHATVKYLESGKEFLKSADTFIGAMHGISSHIKMSLGFI